jgi:hypothetical protein
MRTLKRETSHQSVISKIYDEAVEQHMYESGVEEATATKSHQTLKPLLLSSEKKKPVAENYF